MSGGPPSRPRSARPRPFWIWHSDDARMYTLVARARACGAVAAVRRYERNRPRDWVVYGLVTAVSLYSHYFAILTPPVHAVWLLSQRPPRAVVLRRWHAPVAGAVSLLAVWLVVMVPSYDGVGGVAAIITGGGSHRSASLSARDPHLLPLPARLRPRLRPDRDRSWAPGSRGGDACGWLAACGGARGGQRQGGSLAPLARGGGWGFWIVLLGTVYLLILENLCSGT